MNSQLALGSLYTTKGILDMVIRDVQFTNDYQSPLSQRNIARAISMLQDLQVGTEIKTSEGLGEK